MPNQVYRDRIASAVEDLMAGHGRIAIGSFREQIKRFNKHYAKWLKAQEEDSYYPSPLLWQIEDKLCCYYATLAVIHDAMKVKPPVHLSEGVDQEAAYLLHRYSSKATCPYGDDGLDTALKYVKADIQSKAKAKNGQGETVGPGYDASKLRKVPVSRLIKQGESQTLEFKETLECDTQNKRKEKDILLSSLKTIAGFLNARGGTLLIGVDDSGRPRGIERDLSMMKHANNDRFEQKIRNCLKDRFNPHPIGKVNISFRKLPGATICRVDIQASEDVTRLDGRVYVRDGNTTLWLEGPTLTGWIEKRKTRH